MSAPHGEETIFAEALRLPAPERGAFVAGLTDGKPELRRRVEALLGSYEAGGFLEGAASAELRSTLPVSVPVTEKPGDLIGRYKLLQQIGEGGCGVVYMAEQSEPVRRRVALKIIKLGMDTKSVIARFEAEKQALAMMDHANIAKVFDAGATETGRPYFVMELVRGLKITDYCDEAKLSTRARLDLFVQVCGALQHAHQKGIIHRDIKPSNILVTVNDGVAVPKVIDFGIAKATSGQQLTDKTLFTAFEQFIGTPAYMSPEQAVLTSLDIDTRSDIYALGVLLYELLTGKTPFDGNELLAIGLDEMRRTIREKEPPRPSTVLSTLGGDVLSTMAQRRGLDAPKLVSELRGDLDWIVMKALEKDRARRYETANELAADIERHLQNEPVVARPPSAAYRFKKLVLRNKLAFAAGASVAVALVVGLAIALWQSIEKSRAYYRTVIAETKAQTEAAKSRQIATFLQEMLKSVGPSVASGRDAGMLQDILDKAASRIRTELVNQPEVEAELRNTIGFAYWELGEHEKAEQMYRESLSLLRKIWATDNATVADTLHNLADLLRRIGKLEEAEAKEREALSLYKKLHRGQDAAVGDSLHNLAGLFLEQGKPDLAETVALESLAVIKRARTENHPQVGVCLGQLGRVLLSQGRLTEAEPVLLEAETILRKALAQRGDSGLNPHVELAWALHFKARLLMHLGRLDEGAAAHEDALKTIRKVLGDAHPDAECLKIAFAIALASQGKPAEAEAMLTSLLSNIKQRLAAGVYVDIGQVRRVAQFYETAEKPDQALEWKQKLSEMEKANAKAKADAQ